MSLSKLEITDTILEKSRTDIFRVDFIITHDQSRVHGDYRISLFVDEIDVLPIGIDLKNLSTWTLVSDAKKNIESPFLLKQIQECFPSILGDRELKVERDNTTFSYYSEDGTQYEVLLR